MSASRIHRRDANGTTYRRFRAIDAAPADDGSLDLVLSTDDPVTWGGWREILTHADGAIDSAACRALLINHDPNQIAGTITDVKTNGRQLTCKAKILPGARLESGIDVVAAVKAGALRGVSIGYIYDEADTTYDEQTRTLTVRRWRLLEGTLTPIPADASAGVRSLPFSTQPVKDLPMKITAAQLRTLLAMFVALSDGIVERAQKGDTYEAIETWAKAQTPATQAPDLDSARAAARTEVIEIEALARSVGLEAAPYLAMTRTQAQAKMLADVAARNASQQSSQPPVTRSNHIDVIAAGEDKFIRSASAGLMRHVGHLKAEKDVTPITLPTSELIARCAVGEGFADARDWDRMRLAQWAMARAGYRRDAANKTSGMFSTLLGNTANKVLAAGHESYDEATFQIWAAIQECPDFKSHNHSALASGIMTETPENEAFPELNQGEGNYSSQLSMFGCTVSLSYQMLVNDDLGTFLRSLARAGAMAARTCDREVYYALLNATWTNDETASATLATAGNLDKARAAFRGKLNKAGEKMGHSPRFLLADSANLYNAEYATGQLFKTNEIISGGSSAAKALQVVESTWIGDTTLKSGVLTTDYYLTGNPAIVDTVIAEFLTGMRQPSIVEFDPAAVAAAKFKIMLPFKATVATHTDSAGAARVTGVQRAKVAS